MGFGGFAEPPKDSTQYRRGYLCAMIRGDGGSAGNVRAIEHLISWPTYPCDDWFRGFLAGIFDAEGSYSRGIWRLSNTDPKIIEVDNQVA